MKPLIYYRQVCRKGCGPTCLKMVAQCHGKDFDFHKMSNVSRIYKNGVSLLVLRNAATKIGLNAMGLKLSVDDLVWMDLPLILHWNQCHFVVLYDIKKSTYYIADPVNGKLKLDKVRFLNHWQQSGDEINHFGFVLAFSVT